MAEKSGAADSPQVEALRQQLEVAPDARDPKYASELEQNTAMVQEQVSHLTDKTPAQFSRNIEKNYKKVAGVLADQEQKTAATAAAIFHNPAA